jgi:hypothetical protein
MTATRREVLERLAAMSDAETDQTTTVEALAAALDSDERTVADNLDGLQACELAIWRSDVDVRVTVTGEELLSLDTEELVIVDPSGEDADR